MRHLRVVLVVAALLALPAAAGAVVTRTPNGHRFGIMLRGALKGGGKGGGPKTAGAVLLSHGGPVLSAEAPYLIYWTPGAHTIAASSESLLNQYLTDVAAASAASSTTNVYSVLEQYNAPYSQSFSVGAQAIVDTNPYPTQQSACPLSAGITACVTDASIQAEIARLIKAGTLPAPGTPGTGATPVFLVITPIDVNVCISGSTCSSNSFCAYHSYFANGGGDALYASVPFSVFANGNSKGCQTDAYSIYETPVGSGGNEAYNIADDLSHELSETITDPLVNAWYSRGGLEVGDLCEAYAATVDIRKGLSPLAYSPAFGNAAQGTLYDQLINGDQYYNQTEYSNAAGGCRAGLAPIT